jgi:hypothetical protein
VTTRSFAPTAVVLLVSAALLAGAVNLQAVRETRYPPRDDQREMLYVRSGHALKRMAGALGPLVADAYWIRTIQYYGGKKLQLTKSHGQAPPAGAASSDGYALLYPLLDLTTTLDPRFNIAYRFGAVFLSEAYPAGAGRPDLAIALLEKGLREKPDKWEYMQDAGFVHYWYDHDYRAASDWFRRASEVPGAPWWLKSLAATTLAQGGDRRSSRLMWEAIRQSAEIDWLRTDAERRLLQLRALDEIDALQRAVDEYTRRTGQPPSGWGTLVQQRVVRGVPVDPSRTPYELGAGGRVGLSRSSPLWPPPTEPAAQLARPPA